MENEQTEQTPHATLAESDPRATFDLLIGEEIASPGSVTDSVTDSVTNEGDKIEEGEKEATVPDPEVDSKRTRSGRRWIKGEEKLMLDRVAEGKSFEEIATLHKRKLPAVMSRLKRIAISYAGMGVKFEDISTITGLTVYEIEEAIERRRKGLETTARKLERKKADMEKKKKELAARVPNPAENPRELLIRIIDLEYRVSVLEAHNGTFGQVDERRERSSEYAKVKEEHNFARLKRY